MTAGEAAATASMRAHPANRDPNLDNDVFIEGSGSLLADHGRHPGFCLDFCAAATTYFYG